MRNRSVRICGFILFLALLICGVSYLWPIITPLILAVLLAYILHPSVKNLEKLEVKDDAAIIIVFVYFYILLSAVISFCLPIINAQFESLLALLPDILEQLRSAFDRFAAGINSILLRDIGDRISSAIDDIITSKVTSVLEDTGFMVAAVFRAAFYGVLTPFLAFYVMRDSGSGGRMIASWLPTNERSSLLRLAGDVDHLLRQYVLGYLLVSVAVAFLSTVFYWCIGLENALALGLVMGLADLIPYFGPFIGAIPAVIVALSADTGKAVLTVVGLVIIQQLESIVITPKVMGEKVGLHPLVTVMAVLAGGWFFGIAGTIFAVPVTAAGVLILKYLWSRIVGAKIT